MMKRPRNRRRGITPTCGFAIRYWPRAGDRCVRRARRGRHRGRWGRGPGNAALLYLMAAQQMASSRGEPENNPPGTDDEKIDQWLNTPAHELPREEVRLLLERYAGALRQFRLAARRDRCDFDPPYRTEGFRTLLPFSNDARGLARLGALSARFG